MKSIITSGSDKVNVKTVDKNMALFLQTWKKVKKLDHLLTKFNKLVKVPDDMLPYVAVGLLTTGLCFDII